MKAIVFHGPRDLRFESVEEPKLESATDALVRVTRAAICGSDLHLWHGLYPIAEPGFATGHECVGVVEEVGSAVHSVRPGDRVLVCAVLGCGTCDSCRRGLFSGCTVLTAGGRSNILGFSRERPGGQAERVRVPFADANLFPIPESVNDEQAVLLTDILPTADFANELAEVGPGDSVLVFGGGPVGSLAQLCARLRGAARVIAVEPDAGRRDRSARRGCEVIDPTSENLAERVLELTGGRGADAAIEAVGRPELVVRGVELTRAGGRVAVVGVVLTGVEIPWALVLMKNLRLASGLVNPQRHIPRLLPLIESGRLDPTEIVTHRLPLSEGPRAYEIFAEHREDVLKVMLEP